MKEKDKDYLPYRVRVEKNLEDNEIEVNSHKGVLFDKEKKLFEYGLAKVFLKNFLGEDIEYYKKIEWGEIFLDTPNIYCTYKTNKKMYDDELRRK